jgi:hypothetical protein
MTKRVLTLMLLGILSPAGLWAAADPLPGAGFAFPSIMESGSARAIAMGSTYVGIAEGSAALLWNPAGLALLQDPEIALHHESGLVGSTQEIAVLGEPLGNGNGLGLSLNYEDNGTFDGHDSLGAGTGDYSARSYGASLGWGIRAPLGLSLGLAVKANRQELANTDLNSFAGDAGILWSRCPLLSVGAAYSNLGPSVDGQQLSQGFRAGVSSYLGKGEDYQWLFALSGEALTGDASSVHLGVEHTLYQLLALRAGYAFNVPSAGTAGDLEGWSFGGGLIIRRLSLDYAFVPLAGIGNTQRLSLTYGFGAYAGQPMTETASAGNAVKPITAPLAQNESSPILALTDADFRQAHAGQPEEMLTLAARLRIYQALTQVTGKPGASLHVNGYSALAGQSDAPSSVLAMKTMGDSRSGLVRAYLMAKMPAARVTSLAAGGPEVASAENVFRIWLR